MLQSDLSTCLFVAVSQSSLRYAMGIKMGFIDFFKKKKTDTAGDLSEEIALEQKSKLDEIIDWSKQYDRVNEI